MSPKSSQQYKKIRDEKRNHIMQVALELFANEGYHITTISKIAQKGGISKGLMYNYFKSKEDLLKSILIETIQEIYSSFDRNHDNILTNDEFEYFVRESFRLQNKNRAFYKLYYILLLQPNILELINSEVSNISQKVIVLLIEYFKKSFSDPDTEMLIFSSLMKGLSMQLVFSPDYINDERLEKSTQKILELFKR